MSQQQVLQKDALPSPPASPLAKRPPSAGGEQVAAAGERPMVCVSTCPS